MQPASASTSEVGAEGWNGSSANSTQETKLPGNKASGAKQGKGALQELLNGHRKSAFSTVLRE